MWPKEAQAPYHSEKTRVAWVLVIWYTLRKGYIRQFSIYLYVGIKVYYHPKFSIRVGIGGGVGTSRKSKNYLSKNLGCNKIKIN